MAYYAPTASVPQSPGTHLPDAHPSLSYVSSPTTNSPGEYAVKVNSRDVYAGAPLTSPFHMQHAHEHDFEQVRRIVYNIRERLDGWQYAFAPLKPKMSYGQIVEVLQFERRILGQLPEDVPAPILRSSTKKFMMYMERYGCQFEINGDFLMLDVRAAQELYLNYAINVISNATLSHKMMICERAMECPQAFITNKVTSMSFPNGMAAATEAERAGYCALTRKAKGFSHMMNNARKIAKDAQFQWTMAVVANGVPDKVASHPFNTTFFLLGPKSLEMQTQGGRALRNLSDDVTIYEDALYRLTPHSDVTEEPFVHKVQHGGWCYNFGNEDCGVDEDPNKKYGLAFLVRNSRNWHQKTLLTLARESGRWVDDLEGSLDPHHDELARNWKQYLSNIKLSVAEGLLDPLLFKREHSDIYEVCKYYGEVDPAYCPMEKWRSHARRMVAMVEKELGGESITALKTLNTMASAANGLNRLNEAQGAFVAAVTCGNLQEVWNFVAGGSYAHSPYAAMLALDDYTRGPKIFPRAVSLKDLPLGGAANMEALPASARSGDKALVIEKNNEDCVIMTVALDKAGAANRSRGLPGQIYGYLAVPVRKLTLGYFQTNDQNYFTTINGGNGSLVLETQAAANLPATEDQVVLGYPRTRELAGNVANNEYDQGFMPLRISPVVESPLFVGGLGMQRAVAALYHEGTYNGWNPKFLEEVHRGVSARDSIMKLLRRVYTPKNPYFRLEFVPAHLRTQDNETSSLNGAISGLSREYHLPFLARRPYKSAATWGCLFFPQIFEQGQNDHAVFMAKIAQIVKHLFNNNIGQNDITNLGNNAPINDASAEALLSSIVLDSGILRTAVKDVLKDKDQWKAFLVEWERSESALSFAQYLEVKEPTASQHKKLQHPRALHQFSEYHQHMVVPRLRSAVAELKAGQVEVGTRAGATPQAKDAAKYHLAQAARHIADGIYLLSVAVATFVDRTGHSARFGADQIAALERSLRSPEQEHDVQQVDSMIANHIVAIRQSLATQINKTTELSDYWVNTGLSVGPKMWKQWESDLERYIGNRDALNAHQTYNLPIRPMTGVDYSVPLAGEPQFLSDFLGNAINLQSKKDQIAHATSKKASGELKGASPSGSEVRAQLAQRHYAEDSRMETTLAGYEGAQRSTTSIYAGLYSQPLVPKTFIEHDRSVGSTAQERATVYLTDSHLRITPGALPGESTCHWMSQRLAAINADYQNEDSVGRMASQLYCFSPTNFKTYKNFVDHKVEPFGVGFTQLRPFITDAVSAVLLSVAGSQTAESGLEGVISKRVYDAQHNRFNVIMHWLMGAIVYSKEHVMWIPAQAMHGNLSGLGPSVFLTKEQWDLSNHATPNRDGFVVFNGSNLHFSSIPACVPVGGKYNIDRYADIIVDTTQITTGEQAIPGLIYLITKFDLDLLNQHQYNNRASFYEQKRNGSTNTDTYCEDYCVYNKSTGEFTTIINGLWHYQGIRPTDTDFLNGAGPLEAGEKKISDIGLS